jgi:hypothetical protein
VLWSASPLGGHVSMIPRSTFDASTWELNS